MQWRIEPRVYFKNMLSFGILVDIYSLVKRGLVSIDTVEIFSITGKIRLSLYLMYIVKNYLGNILLKSRGWKSNVFEI